jgi:hypothetical protein
MLKNDGENESSSDAIEAIAKKTLNGILENGMSGGIGGAVSGIKELGNGKGYLTAIFFVTVILLPALGSLLVYRELIPYVCIALGAAAISIAVQQGYLVVRSKDKERTAYLYGAGSLVCFGGASIVFGLLIKEPVLRLIDVTTLRLIPFIGICIGYACLARFAVLYLHRGQEFQPHSPFLLFSPKEWFKCTLELISLGLAILTLLAATFSYFGIPPPADFFKISGSTDVFSFNSNMLLTILVAMIASFGLIIANYISLYFKVKQGDEILNTLYFFQAMYVVFALSSLLQAIMLYWYSQDKGTAPVAGHRTFGYVVGIILIVLVLFLIASAKDRVRREMVLHMLAPIVLVSGAFLIAYPLMSVAPVSFLALGCLTLGFAYLPADDLTRNQARKADISAEQTA